MHCYSYPWQKYVKLGSVLRHFAYTVAALHGCLESEIQVQQKPNFSIVKYIHFLPHITLHAYKQQIKAS
jgi:hypothetical protein